MELNIHRDTLTQATDLGEGFSLGKLHIDGEYFCETLEDEDRQLEQGNGKVYGKSAIPRGRYEIELYLSPRHGLVPMLQDVPGFKYIEIHKANRSEELLGCIGVGAERTARGVRNCSYTLATLIQKIQLSIHREEKVYITVA